MWRPKLDGVDFKQISIEDNMVLIVEFEVEEMKEAIWDCSNDKSPISNGLIFLFIKEFWELLKGDIWRFLVEFHKHGVFPRGTNSSFISLITKCENPQNFGDFKPISLIGCPYKILAKMLANRLKRVFKRVIDERKIAFLGGRQLLHNVVVANEVEDDAKRRKKNCLIFKVDFEQAYNSVSWDFLFYMLHQLGIHKSWIKWIKGCLESSWTSVLVNESPTKEFKCS